MLFKSKSAPSQSPAVPAPAIQANPATDIAARRVDPVQHSVIPYGMQVTGDLFSRGDISVKGNIQGNITCRTLTLEGEPVIGGSVQAETIRICGSFNGDVLAK